MEQNIAQKILEMYLVYPVDDQEKANLLLKELSYLSPAVVRAADYINTNNITLHEYLSLLTKKKEELAEFISREHENVIATTWLFFVRPNSLLRSIAANYLLFMACVDRIDVPIALLLVVSRRKYRIHAVKSLSAYSFTSIRTAESALELYRILHVVTRDWLENKGLLVQQTQAAIIRSPEVFLDNNYGSRSKWRQLLLHTKFIPLSSLPARKDIVARKSLVRKCALSLLENRIFKEAEAYF
jgi:hypothetical protein